MSVDQMMLFLLDVFQMATIALVFLINQNLSNRLHLFWDTLNFLCSVLKDFCTKLYDIEYSYRIQTDRFDP